MNYRTLQTTLSGAVTLLWYVVRSAWTHWTWPKQNRMAGHFHQSHSTGHWPQSSTAYFSGRHSGNVQTVWNLHMTPSLSFVVHVYVCRLDSKPPYWINRSTNAERCQFEKQYGRDRAPVDCHVKRTYCFGDIKSNQKYITLLYNQWPGLVNAGICIV